MKKRLLSLFLALALLCAMLPPTTLIARADDPVYSGACGDDLTWTFDPDTGALIIEGSGAMTDYSDSSTVPWKDFTTQIKGLTLPAGLTSIGAYTFNSCSKLSSVTFPEGLASIGTYAFSRCTGLKSLTFPAALKSIGSYTFYNCYGLKSVTFPTGLTSIGYRAFSQCSGLPSVTLPEGLTTLDGYAFEQCYNLESVVFPDSLSSIGYGAFDSCGLTSLTFPEGLVTISGYAFHNCNELTAITFPQSLTSIGNQAFQDCIGLTQLTFSEGLRSIGNLSFSSCTGLTSVSLPQSLTGLNDSAFPGCTALRSFSVAEGNPYFSTDERGVLFNKNKTKLIVFPPAITGEYSIPDGVTSLGSSAFSKCAGLTSVSIPASLSQFKSSMFSGCTGLTSFTVAEDHPNFSTDACGVLFNKDKTTLILSPCGKTGSYSIPNGVTAIGDHAFDNCGNLTEVSFPEGLATIGEYAFNGCDKLTEVSFPDGLSTIKNCAFQNADGLREISLPESVNYIGNNVFSSCSSLAAVTSFSADCRYSGDGCFGSKARVVLIGAPDSPIQQYAADSGYAFVPFEGAVVSGSCGGSTDITWSLDTTTGTILFDGTGYMYQPLYSDTTSWFRYRYFIKNAVLSEGITTVRNHCFQDCYKLEAISLPESLNTIYESAFNGCESLSSITIPQLVNSIKENAFSGCIGLSSATILNFNCRFTNAAFPINTTLYGYAYSTAQNYAETNGNPFVSLGYTVLSGSCGAEGDNLTWTLDTETGLLTITGSGAMADYGPYSFSADSAPWYANADLVKSLSLAEGITTLGNYAFKGCQNLTEVSLPTGLSSLGKGAFQGCTALTEIVLPDGITTTGERTFISCSGLSSVTIPQSVTVIGEDTFYGCSSLTEIALPSNLSQIGRAAFYNCTGLTELCFPESLTGIGKNAFYGCSGLQSVTIPQSVTSIGTGAFSGCDNLSAVTIYSFFCSISGGDTLAFPEGTTLYGYRYSTTQTYAEKYGYAFVSLGYEILHGTCGAQGDNLTWTLDTETGVLTIEGSGAMYTGYYPPWNSCKDLITEVLLPEGLTSLGQHAFSGCTGLTVVKNYSFSCHIYEYDQNTLGTPGQTTLYGYSGSTTERYAKGHGYTFISLGYTVLHGTCGAEGDNLTWTLDTETGVLTIEGSGAMYTGYNPPWYTGKSLITEVHFPEGLTSIGQAAFSDCSGLTEVTIPAGVTAIGERAFTWCTGLTSIALPEGLTDLGDSAFSNCTGLISVTIPDGLTAIGGSAFCNCTGLTSVTIPDGVTSIGDSAFSGCTGLTSIELPDSVTSLGARAFAGCSSLTSVMISAGVTDIAEGTFSGCSSLDSVTIPEGVTTIGMYAFGFCTALDTVRLPESVELIGFDAFRGCSALTALIVSNPETLVTCDDISILPDDDTAEDLYCAFFTSDSLGVPGKTIIYGKHDAAKENAEPIKEPVTVWQHSYDNDYQETLNLVYRYAENYAKTCGYTFYEIGAFADVAPGKWYEIPVAWAYGKGITSGTGNGKFSPNATCTREQIATFIWKAYDSPEPGGTVNPFTDVNPEKYYAPAVLWAYYHEPQITGGMNAETFGVGKPCTRAQVVTFLYAAAGKPEPTTTENPFIDVKETDYFYKAVLWAVENGITSGVSPTSFAPKQTCTRAQVVTFLYKAVR